MRLETNNPNFIGRSYIKNLDNHNESYQGPNGGGFLNSAYAGASYGRNQDWLAQRLSPNGTIRTSLDLLRVRSQDLCRNNDYARNIIRIYRNNIIGNGVTLQSQIHDSDDKLDRMTNNSIERLWKRWCNKKYCSVNGQLSFNIILRQIINETLISGECFVRVFNRKTTSNAIPLQLQIISSEFCPFDIYPQSNGGTWNLGIETDDFGKPMNYCFYTRNPNDFNMGMSNEKQYIRIIPASEIIHVKLRSEELSNLARGIPILYSSILTLKDLWDYRGIEITRAQCAAAVMGFIESIDETYQSTDNNGENNLRLQSEPMQAGSFRVLDPNTKLNIPHIQSPSGNFGAFVRSNGETISAGSGVSYASLTGDYSKSNYSSSRLNSIDVKPIYKTAQQDLGEFLDDVYERWIELAVLKLRLNVIDKSLDDYYEHKWMYYSQPYIDPDKEIRANINAINSGLKSRSQVLSEQGIDFDQHLEEIKRENDKIKKLELDFNNTVIGSQIPKNR